MSFDPAIMGDDAQLNLAVCYVRMGKLQAAKGIFQSLLASPTRGQQAADNLKALASLGQK